MNSPIAIRVSLDKIKQIKSNYYFRRDIERVDLIDSVGRDLGETIYAYELAINEDIAIQEKDFNYILFVKKAGDRANTMGYESSEMKLCGMEYDTSLISASPRSTIVDGYVMTDMDIRKGERVLIHLFS